ncbi:MAG: methyltransferase domain-containing protein [Desulfobacterales bacterium]
MNDLQADEIQGKDMKEDVSLIAQLPPPYNYYRLISDNDHLHFGLWDDEISELSIYEAQQNMFEQLMSFLPEPPAKILDVGCRLGLSAHLLCSKGFTVTAIASFPELIDYAIQQYGSSGADFRALDYFDNDDLVFAEGIYDVLLFQESLQYLHPINEVMVKARHLLKDRGIIIIGDEVCYDKTIKAETTVHMSPKIYTALAENGFRVTEHQKIGKDVILTCEIAIERLTKHFDYLVSVLNDPNAEDNLLFFLNGLKKQKTRHENGRFGYEIFVGKKDPFFIRQYKEGDEHKILAMFKEVFKVDRSLEHWYWKYKHNPYGSYKICMTFSQDGKMVSHYAGFPVRLCSAIEDDGKLLNFTVPQIGDTMTAPSVRRIGLGKTGILARTSHYFYAKFCEGSVPFGYGPNTANMRKLGERYLGYVYLDPVPFWIKDLSHSPPPRPGLLSRILQGFTVEEVHSVNDEWDALFDRLCPVYKFLIRRDATYVKWRYLDCPDKVHRVFTVRKSGALVGWSVFSFKNNKLLWGDALFDSERLDGLSHLFYHLSTECFPVAESIEAWFSHHPEWWSNHLKTLGFKAVSEPNDLAFCYHTFWNDILDNEKLHEKLNNSFYYTWGDSDLF